MNKVLFLILVCCTLSFTGIAQDRIIQVTNDTIRCKVKEIGDDEVKYIQNELAGDVIFGIDKNKVSKIIFGDNKELIIKNSMFDASQYDNQRKNALKIGFLSPLVGATCFSYERSLRPGRSLEGTVGIIGLGVTGPRNAEGVYFKFGYKLIKTPDYYQKGTRFAHILNGAYLRPEISFSNYTVESSMLTSIIGGSLTNDKGTRESNTMFAFMINIGKQWVIENRFLIDWYGGLGYGFGHTYENEGSHFAFVGGVPSFPLAATTGVRIGFLF